MAEDKYSKAGAVWGPPVQGVGGGSKFTDRWPLFSRKAFTMENNSPTTYYIRPVSHAQYCPDGFHIYVKHPIPFDATGSKQNLSYILCTKSYDPSLPCFVCDLVVDLDESGWFKNCRDAQLKEMVGNMSVASCGSVYIPMLAYADITEVQGTKGGVFKNLVPSDNVQELNLSLTAESADQNFFNKFLEKRAEIPTLDNITFGSWLAYTRAPKEQTLVVAPPSRQRKLLPQELELCSDKLYPKLTQWGANPNRPERNFVMTYQRARDVVKASYLPKALENWDFDSVPVRVPAQGE